MNERLGILEEWFTLAGQTIFFAEKEPYNDQ